MSKTIKADTLAFIASLVFVIAMIITVFTASAAHAEGQIGEPVQVVCCDIPAPEKPRDTSASDNSRAAAAVFGLIGLWVLLDALSDQPVEVEHGPYALRPEVRPEGCLEKVGTATVITACK